MNNDAKLFSRIAESFHDSIEALAGPIVLRRYPDGGIPHEKCVALLGLDGDVIVLRTAAYDSAARNLASSDNVKTWELGDAVEMFLQPAGREDYYEFHVTPEGIRLQLRLQDYMTHRQVEFEDKIAELGLKVRSKVENGGVWISEMRVPLESLGIDSTAGMRYAVCRYNYGLDGLEPELSCSFPATEDLGFHNPPAWSSLP